MIQKLYLWRQKFSIKGSRNWEVIEGNIRSHFYLKPTFCSISFFKNLIKICMNAIKIMMQIFHYLEFDLKGHWRSYWSLTSKIIEGHIGVWPQRLLKVILEFDLKGHWRSYKVTFFLILRKIYNIFFRWLFIIYLFTLWQPRLTFLLITFVLV